ncbi:PEP-CTERM sorting domain-containing protein [Parvularcula sp. LCG005]|uniref:PEP-CTERM sorting domain-containing protein n=1 Tax=Parvularcula sp. LCG005 TaxID=3078805 RepID=UPI002942F0C1|nr:PEP-CTERM sorting domain-containing protein [Parvularcula sp. LCG005]WOI54492.1 PEP-CTERM sorting domain-containing protein [Parvularcula sp. LCG005]
MKVISTLAAMAAACLPLSAFAQSITPASHEDTIDLGSSGSVEVTVSTPTEGTATDLIDVVFLADNTGSMSSELSAVKAEAFNLLTALGLSGADIRYAVTSYFGDPVEGNTPGNTGSNDRFAAYNAIQTFTSDTTAVQGAINQWFASGGGDGPEAAIYSLHQIATGGADSESGVGSGIDLGFRSSATKIVVWFGDIGNHEDTVDVPEAIAALQAAGITVIAISSGGSLNRSGDSANQATRIVEATGGIEATAGSTDLAAVILDTLGDVTDTIDLNLTLSEMFPGLPVTVTCTSVGGCDDVGLGESRTFLISYNGMEVGTYTFTASVTGLSVSVDPIRITVVDGTPEVPVPAAAVLFLTGLAGFVARRKKARA